MRILAIETSCDETAMSLLETSDGTTFDLLAHEVSSQIEMHREWGGVVPMLAKREHNKTLPVILEKIAGKVLSSKRKAQSAKLADLIAVTYGPGLEPALWTGIVFAKELATKWGVPIVATDHMHGHVVSAMLKLNSNGKAQSSNVTYGLQEIHYPAIALLISGAHTELVLMRSMGEPARTTESDGFEILGHTVDDAVGEAFDKVARMLGLPYPGGPEISKLASKFVPESLASGKSGDEAFGPNAIKLPRPMLHSKDYNFSFSGLKTAVLYLVKNIREKNKLLGLIDENGDGILSDETKCEIAYEFEQAVTEVLIKKTERAIAEHGAKSLLVGGGVIANKAIRKALSQLQGLTLKLYLPDNKFTGDNATMIGVAALLRLGYAGQGYLHPEHLLTSGTPEFEALSARGNLNLYK